MVDHDSPTIIHRREGTRIMAVPVGPPAIPARPLRRLVPDVSHWGWAEPAPRRSPLRRVPVWAFAGGIWYAGWAVGAWPLGFLAGLVVIGAAVVADRASREPKPKPVRMAGRRRWFAGVGVGLPGPFWAGVGRRFGR